MKSKMIQYMLNREINPIEFADFVNLHHQTESFAANKTGKKRYEPQSSNLLELLLVGAILLVGAFLLTIYFL
jgi:hypothetical protein